ncbi:2-polyprenyl-3-methyl-6-methoxy-1,4-benzoquinone monooxygenase [Sulfuriflexus mobilis]|uniref:2-polyprenyl-3-methyl-6-methoxy-1,4-benzoquinone monooxygenase n=1 Tax=Sulfuriflexus mobilis TaxID=1811807 RepID=UPI000F82D8F4|nr:2-polyprenyl-3-methyl-6-methoxy-1,4-benzoquinone monooxygenase [Sulfuriflexus mobilis]
MKPRTYSSLDQLAMNVDQALRTVFGRPQVTERENPSQGCAEVALDETERQHVAGLMRINHVGEVCAQALYQGQALTAKLDHVRTSMQRAAQEENDHLAWCEQRLGELHSHKSLLNPFWYGASFAMGAAAGLAGDKWSLGFVAETEQQVVRHLDEHLAQLPEQDEKSRAILEQMKIDEGRHATVALEAGGAELPTPIKQAMRLTSKLMTRTAYRI